VGELSVLSSALKSAREARIASDSIGRQRAELVAALRNDPLAEKFLTRAAAEQWPFSSAISAALESRVIGAPLAATLCGLIYASVAAIIASAMKLLRLGQNASQSLLVEALREAPALITAAEKIPVDEIGWFNPWLDIAAARHESADSRMFIS
jgi:urease accessory protein